jgi:transcriptional regulator with XRE-family HTH domain
MKLEKIIGSNIARLRTRWQMSQPEFGERMGREIGKNWSRQTVSAVENGDRAFTASDLVLLSYVLEVPVSALLLLPPDAKEVEAGPRTFRRDELEASSWQTNETSDTLRDVADVLTEVKVRLQRLGDDAHEIEQLAAPLSAAAIRLRMQQSLEAKGAGNGK